ncbi:hypothetical protein [Limnoglobus roseus]|uniref:Uncharacterized protein n=1 Tax=Limnoglobus roseus TaxID=2598579 RepID=A0A5C1APL0_9BACT|nr:hypothetical protein [Limnoglobus roseus]QEL20525.1 hypothetical protein PX52LOC_07630 [Limnoglobus roseus]
MEKLVYVDLIWKRDKWVAERDKKENGPVPKGAAKVSMGDALAKFHEQAPKGPKVALKSAEDLKKAIVSYKEAIKSKYPKFFTQVEKLEKNVDSYVTAAKQIVDRLANYATLRQKASEQMLVAGAEFLHWEKAGSVGQFAPSNAKPLLEALKAFITAVQSATFCNDKITKDASKTFDRTVYAADGGAWSKATVDGLVKQLKEFPASV